MAAKLFTAFRIPPEMKAEILALARAWDVNYSQAIRFLLVEGMKNIRTRGSE